MNFKKTAIAFSIFALSSTTLPAAADGYIGAQYALTTIDGTVSGVGTAEWEPKNLVIFAGVNATENVALEGRLGFSLSDDSINGSALEVSNLFGVYGKFSLGDKVSPYLIAGFSEIELDSNVAGSASDNDFSYGLGLDIAVSENTSINLEYMSYYEESEGDVSVDITAFAFGLSHKF